MPRWTVELKGAEADLKKLAASFSQDELRIAASENGYCLTSTQFESMNSARDVRSHAEHLLEVAARITRHIQPPLGEVKLGVSIKEDRPGGGGGITITPEPLVLRISMSDPTVSISGEVQPPPPPPDLRPEANLFLGNSHLVDALRYIQDDPGMHGYFNAAEAVLKALDPSAKKKNWKVLVNLGLATKDDYERFLGSVHPKRHHDVKPHKKPMNERQARKFVCDLLDKVIANRLASNKPNEKQTIRSLSALSNDARPLSRD